MRKVGERLRPLGAGYRVYEIWRCPDCGYEEDRATDFMQFSRSKYGNKESVR
jgi:hypothetical protein